MNNIYKIVIFSFSILLIQCSIALPRKQKVNFEFNHDTSNISCKAIHLGSENNWSDTSYLEDTYNLEVLELDKDTIVKLQSGYYHLVFSKKEHLAFDTIIKGERLNPYGLLAIPVFVGVFYPGLMLSRSKNESANTLGVFMIAYSTIPLLTDGVLMFTTPYSKLYKKKQRLNVKLDKIHFCEDSNITITTLNDNTLLTKELITPFFDTTSINTSSLFKTIYISYKFKTDSSTHRNKTKAINYSLTLNFTDKSQEVLFSKTFKYPILKPFTNNDYLQKKYLRLSLNNLSQDESFQAEIKNITKKKNEELITIAKQNYYLPTKGLGEIPESVITIKTNKGLGTGFIISKSGYAITTADVVDGSYKKKGKYDHLDIYMKNGSDYTAKVIRVNREANLALIKLSSNHYQPIKLSTDNQDITGSTIYSISAQLDKELGLSISKGIISKTRSINNKEFLYLDVSINYGSSGAPVVNKKGVVLGVIMNNDKIDRNNLNNFKLALSTKHIEESLSIKFK